MESIINISSHSINVEELFGIDIYQYPNQRPLNKDWVNKLKLKQYEYIEKYGSPLIVGAFSIVEVNTRPYMIDGQHRLQLLREMYDEGIDLSNCIINIINYKCHEFSLANDIYFMLNNQYASNGNIDSEGRVYGSNEVSKQLIILVQDRFSKTIKCKEKSKIMAPYFDINDLMREINISRITDIKSAYEIFNLVINFNQDFGEKLLKKDPKQYQKCLNIEGFFLPYLSTQCKWFKEVSKDFLKNL